MKITKPFCIDDELIHQLKKLNASDLVNSLLREYFDGKNSENLAKLKQKLSENLEKKKVLLRETREIRRKIVLIQRKENLILNLQKKIPAKLIDSMKNYDEWTRFYLCFKSEVQKAGYMDTKKIFYELKGGND